MQVYLSVLSMQADSVMSVACLTARRATAILNIEALQVTRRTVVRQAVGQPLGHGRRRASKAAGIDRYALLREAVCDIAALEKSHKLSRIALVLMQEFLISRDQW